MVYFDYFVPGLCAAFQYDLFQGHGKTLGQEFQQLLIGFAVDWRCGQFDFELTAMQADRFCAACAGLHVKLEDQMAVAVEAIPVH